MAVPAAGRVAVSGSSIAREQLNPKQTKSTVAMSSKQLDHLGFLCAGDGVHAVHDEAGHAVDPQAVGPQIVGMHGLGFVVGGQEAADRCASMPQDAAMAARTPGSPISLPLEKCAANRASTRLSATPSPLAKRTSLWGIDGRRRAADAVEAEGQAFLPPDIGDRCV